MRGVYMVGFAKAILISILAVVLLMLLINLAFFFPWYLTIVEMTFEVSQMVANDNYLSAENYEFMLSELERKPVFDTRIDDLEIEVYRKDELNTQELIEGKGPPHGSDDNPYVQRGEEIIVTVSARYPLQMTFWGRDASDWDWADIPVSFTMVTTTLRLFKDLPWPGIEDYGNDDWDENEVPEGEAWGFSDEDFWEMIEGKDDIQAGSDVTLPSSDVYDDFDENWDLP